MSRVKSKEEIQKAVDELQAEFLDLLRFRLYARDPGASLSTDLPLCRRRLGISDE